MKRETTCNSFRTSALNGVKTELYNLTNVHFYTANKYTYRDKCISYKLINITLQLELCADFIVSAKARRSILVGGGAPPTQKSGWRRGDEARFGGSYSES